MSRCLACNKVMSNRDLLYVEATLEDKTKVYADICKTCRHESMMEHSVLMKDYHCDQPSLESPSTAFLYSE